MRKAVADIWILGVIFFMAVSCSVPDGSDQKILSEAPVIAAEPFMERFLSSHGYFREEGQAWGNYTLDLTIEAILEYTLISGDSAHIEPVLRFFSQRGYRPEDTIDYRQVPFADAYFAYYLYTGHPEFAGPYVEESRRMRRELPRKEDGIVCILHMDSAYMLIDYLQHYAIRMARAGSLSGDTSFFRECVQQFRLYRQHLRYPGSGLYSQGRGWMEDPAQLSPSCWSRGQGWLIRGMVTSLEYLPRGSAWSDTLRSYLEELSEALLKAQNPSGMWHTLPCLADSLSHPEVSGTGMIAYYLARACGEGFLKDEVYREPIGNALRGLHPYLLEDGTIRNVSPGPGPLRTVTPYRAPGETNEPHGYQAAIRASAAGLILRHHLLEGV